MLIKNIESDSKKTKKLVVSSYDSAEKKKFPTWVYDELTRKNRRLLTSYRCAGTQ
jgi:hypothetical protein